MSTLYVPLWSFFTSDAHDTLFPPIFHPIFHHSLPTSTMSPGERKVTTKSAPTSGLSQRVKTRARVRRTSPRMPRISTRHIRTRWRSSGRRRQRSTRSQMRRQCRRIIIGLSGLSELLFALFKDTEGVLTCCAQRVVGVDAE